MVVRLLLSILLITTWISAQEIKVTASIEEKDASPHRPLRGTITVTYPKTLQVDRSSFRFEGRPLPVEFIRQVPIDPLVIDFFRFEISAKPPGDYFLPKIQVKVDGRTYESQPTPYRVKGVASAPSVEDAFLKLETVIEGKEKLYPGERTRVGYRYSYRQNIELAKEQLPLLNPEGFRKIGEKRLREGVQDTVNIFEVTQEIEAVRPGTYKIGPSLIEGYPYTSDLLGRKSYSRKLLQAEAEPITLEVLPFPSLKKPASFTGAVGQFSMTVNLISSSTVSVGETLTIELVIAGEGDFSLVQAPNLRQDPEFTGLFQLSDLPSVGEVEGNKKRFRIDLKPLSPALTRIPSIEFSYFDPKIQTYQELTSSPIPIQVNALQKQEREPKPPTIEEMPLSSIQVTSLPFIQRWISLLIVPLSLVFLLFQVQLRQWISQVEIDRREASDHLFSMAFSQKDHKHLLPLLYRAFCYKLVELGEISSPKLPLDQFPSKKCSQKVLPFLMQIEKWHYSPMKAPDIKQILSEAKTLLKEISK